MLLMTYQRQSRLCTSDTVFILLCISELWRIGLLFYFRVVRFDRTAWCHCYVVVKNRTQLSLINGNDLGLWRVVKYCSPILVETRQKLLAAVNCKNIIGNKGD